MKKRILTSIVLFTGLFLMTSCNTTQTQIQELNYTIEFIKEESIELPSQVMCEQGGVWVLTSAKNTPLYFYDSELYSFTKVDLCMDENEYITALSENKGVLVICIRSGNKIQIRSRQQNGAWSTLAEFPIMTNTSYNLEEIRSLWIDSQQNYYFVLNDSFCIVDEYGNYRSFSIQGKPEFIENSGKIQCVLATSDGIKLSTVVGSNLKDELNVTYPCNGNLHLIDITDTVLRLIVNDSLLCIDIDSGEILSECNLLQCGINADEIIASQFINVDSDEKLCLYGKNANNHLVLYQLGNTEKSDTKPRKEIIYGTLAVNNTIMNQIVKFNKENKDYYITTRVFGNGDLEDGRRQMQIALSSKDAPDIVNLYFIDNDETYVSKGYLEELTPYIQSWELEQSQNDDLLWQIIDPYKTESGLYTFMPHFTLSGLVISADDTQLIDNWDTKSMFTLIEKNSGKKNIFTVSSAEQILSLSLIGMQDDYIDYSLNKCDFTNKNFEQLLYYCKTYGKQQTSTGTLSMNEMADQTLFLNMTFASCNHYLTITSTYGSGTMIYGYPTADGHIYVVNKPFDACGINSASDNKDGAWEFMKTLLTPSYQEIEGIGFPIRSTSWNNMWNNAKGINVRVNGGEACSIEDKDIDIFNNIIQTGRFKNNAINEEIKDIILEESANFFYDNKSASDTAKIIQNRVQLVLDEQ